MLYPYGTPRFNVVTNLYPGQLAPIGAVCHFTDGCRNDHSVDWQAAGIGAHFLVRQDGSVDQYADTNDFLWHGRTASRYYLGIEHVARPQRALGTPPAQQVPGPYCYLTETQLSASALLLAWLSLLYGFPVRRSFGCAFTPGIKAHFDGMEPGCTWNPAGHWDGVWGADVNWLSNWQAVTLDYTTPWSWAVYEAVTNYYVTWWQNNWGIMGDSSYYWYGPYSYFW